MLVPPAEKQITMYKDRYGKDFLAVPQIMYAY